MSYPVEGAASGSGFKVQGYVSEAVDKYDLVALSLTSGWWVQATSAISGRFPATGIATESIPAGSRGEILLKGIIHNNGWSFSAGDVVYLSSVRGQPTTSPDTTGDQQIVGYATEDTVLHFSPKQVRGTNSSESYYRYFVLIADVFGRPNTNPPAVVEQDNIILYAFTVNTDKMFVKTPIPSDYVSGPIEITVYWTNDGGVDDLNRNVKTQIDYQVTNIGDSVAGSHANSPRSIQDTYTSASGWIEHRSDPLSIPETDFNAEDCLFMKITFITPTGDALTCEPHLIGLCLGYVASPDR